MTGLHELADELSIPLRERKKLRTSHLSESDWQRTSKGKIVLTEEGERKVRLYAAAANEIPEVVPFFDHFVVTHVMPNPRWVRIKVPDGAGEWHTELCAVPIRLHGRMRKGMKIRVEVVSDNSGTSYRHESLSAY